jgi:hypothetical protein
MTNQSFIVLAVRERFARDRKSGHLYVEGGTLFSYGPLYPLAWMLVDGVAVLNSAGFSPTTSRHVARARAALASTGLRVVAIPLNDNYTRSRGGLYDAEQARELTLRRARAKRAVLELKLETCRCNLALLNDESNPSVQSIFL